MVRVYFGETLGEYGFGQDHPFGSDRIHAFWTETVKQGLDKKVDIGMPSICAKNDLTRFHTQHYVDRVYQLSKNGEGYLDNGDTPAFKGMFEAASYVVGSDLDGLNEVIQGEHSRVFVPIAGLHHASRNSAAGFCVFNDAGILIETLRREFGIKRIAYVDIDAHHGDGVYYAFEDDPDVIIADIHEDGRYLYPGTGWKHESGKGIALGTKLNVPLLPDSGDDRFFRAWPEIEEFIRAGKPEIILFQAGADSIKGDPITHLNFSPDAHRHASKRLCSIADEFCQGRIIAMGGGGYNRNNLALAWNAVIDAMLEI